ncbi:hypothetical protein CR513_44333, partial [Mucuna pruriens]
MVKKPNGKWRMCIDYTNLNKACPKDPYPLPSIDQLVDGASGFALLSFRNYPTWLTNVVMVKKPNGKWRMCTDYTDLNKACPKDPYPLPSIDQLVDGASSFALLSFRNVYSGYNQIKMHP